MARANIFIRKVDEAKWAALKNKSEFIHAALNGKKDDLDIPHVYMVEGKSLSRRELDKMAKLRTRPDREKLPPSPIKSVIPKIIKTPQDAIEAIQAVKQTKGWQPPVIQLDEPDTSEKCPRHHIPMADCVHLH